VIYSSLVKKNYKEKLVHIKQFIFDMDGVFTDGRALILSDGQVARQMNLRDALAINRATSAGLNVALISRGTDEAFKEKLKYLGVQDVYMNIYEKEEALADLVAVYGWKEEEMLYMGDDLPDLGVMARVGLSCCPQDAVADVRERVDYISHFGGGMGCIRDVIEQSMKLKGLWTL
jgi:3-deoxy-D-manno-octulosonate 8-phosphate phosphatase (KDO 8-P phosphatase)